MSESTWFVVGWELEGLPFLFDTDSGAQAHDVASRLAEQGRENVHVWEVECEVPPEAERRIRERVMRAIASEQSIALLEAAR